jgi:hypothetical protein
MLDPDYNVWLVEPNKNHTLEVKAKRDNFSKYREDFTMGVAESRVVEAKLKYQMGMLAVQSTPEADVYLNDKNIGTTMLWKEIQAGEYTLTLKASRHYNVVKKITISPEDTTFVREILPVNYSSYRRNGIISAASALLCVGGALYTSSEANKAYNQYIETMDRGILSDRRNKAKTLDLVSYVGYGLAGAFAVWSVLEWVGLLTSSGASSISALENDNQWLNLSLSNKGLRLTFQLH